jgi:hypothetical protein
MPAKLDPQHTFDSAYEPPPQPGRRDRVGSAVGNRNTLIIAAVPDTPEGEPQWIARCRCGRQFIVPESLIRRPGLVVCACQTPAHRAHMLALQKAEDARRLAAVRSRLPHPMAHMETQR